MYITHPAHCPAGVSPLSFKSTGSPFFFRRSSIHPLNFCVLSAGARFFGVYTSWTIAKNSSDASSTDMPSLASMIAIRLLDDQRMIGPRNGTYPPVPVPPMRSKCSQGRMILAGSLGYLSHWSRCIISPIISNCDSPRAPPPSIGDACQKRRMNKNACEPKLASLSLLRDIEGLYSSLFRSALVVAWVEVCRTNVHSPAPMAADGSRA